MYVPVNLLYQTNSRRVQINCKHVVVYTVVMSVNEKILQDLRVQILKITFKSNISGVLTFESLGYNNQ